MKLTVAVGLLMAVILMANVDARLPPPEARRIPSASSPPNPPSDASKPIESDSSQVHPSESGSVVPDQDAISSAHDELEEAFRQNLQAFRAFDLFRQQLNLMRPRWISPGFSFAGTDDDSAEYPMTSESMFPLFRRYKPDFSFFSRMPELPLSVPSIQGFDPLAKGYKKVNSTRFVVNEREYCQTTYEKVEDKGFGVFTSRIITAQPCDQESKKDHEGPATDLPTSEDNSKKQGDRRAARPGVEREDQPTETPAAAGSNNREPNEIKPEVTKQPEESTTTVQPTEQPSENVDSKSKEKSVENEISDKPAEPSRSEPTITVNDGK